MTEEFKDANEELGTSTDSSPVENEQDSNVREDAQNTESKSYEQKYKEALAALRQEREKTKALKQQPVPAPVAPQGDESDPAYQAFLRTQADAYIAKKLAMDSTFRDLAPMIEEKVAQGMDIFSAEREVKAEMFERIAKEGQGSDVTVTKPKTLEPTAIPEQIRPKLSGNVLDDVVKGRREDVPPEMAEAIRRIRGN